MIPKDPEERMTESGRFDPHNTSNSTPIVQEVHYSVDMYADADTLIKNNDQQYIEQMGQLKEKTLLLNGKWYLLACLVMSFIGCVYPFGQAISPVHEGDICICYYFVQRNLAHQYTLFGGYPILNMFRDNQIAFNVLRAINMVTFYSLNWVFLFIMIYSVFKIRHNKDRLEIRSEMRAVAVLWSFFCGL